MAHEHVYVRTNGVEQRWSVSDAWPPTRTASRARQPASSSSVDAKEERLGSVVVIAMVLRAD
jgi:hypothetical protein